MAASYFPLRTINEVVKLFAYQCDQEEPDLVLLSIVAGSIENAMTKVSEVNLTHQGENPESSISDDPPDLTNANLRIEPPIEWHLVEALQEKFESLIKGYCDPVILERSLQADATSLEIRKVIKHVADIIWNTLTKGQYKDRPHIQSIYSYLTGNKLDCFGVAFAVVAACQMLQVPGVHLALSEDHAWVVFGADGTETAEVTWHGKGNEDKRGQSVEINKAKTSWLYVAGQPVVCDRHMEVAALVSSINPAINATFDSIEVGALQQDLLWLLQDRGFLKHYPMALGNLGDLEEVTPSLGRPHCLRLFEEAIEVNCRVYNNHHVYPYTYMGGYFYRSKEYPKALETWANAADVIKRYSYSKDDEEIYKEFMEIANELIPHMLKSEDSRVINDPLCFANVLRFYDGICSWEEGSATPIMHIGWAKPMVSTCSKFDVRIRRGVECSEDSNEDDTEISSCEILCVNNNYYKDYCDKSKLIPSQNATTSLKSSKDSSKSSAKAVMPLILDMLSEFCHSQILNVDYLLGQSSQPFTKTSAKLRRRNSNEKKLKSHPVLPGLSSPDRSSSSTSSEESKVLLKLKSGKMTSLKDLLFADKLNTNAIQLQLTALSQQTKVNVNLSSNDQESYSSRPKRSRRE